MEKTFPRLILAILLFSPAVVGFAGPSKEEDKLTIYAYDSFVSEWGPAGKVIPRFTEETGIEVNIISVGDAGSVLSRAIFEKNDPKADILLGIDNNMLARAIESGVLKPYESPNLDGIPNALIFDSSHHVTPFDYGYFSIVYDSQAMSDPPGNLEALTEPRYRDKIIVEDPRTSSPGLGFLLWTIAVYGDEYLDYWKRLVPNLLTITESWDTAYGIFTSGEAPMVLSYTTSPAYHAEYEASNRFRALVFEEGNYLQIEGMGIVNGTKRLKEAETFIDYILTESFQKEIPLTNWMYPVNPDTPLPSSFDYAPLPLIPLSLDAGEIRRNQERWLQQWAETVSR